MKLELKDEGRMKKRKKKAKKKKEHAKPSRLLAVAEQQEKQKKVRREKERKKGKGKRSSGVRALVRLLEKKEVKKKSKDGGGPSESSSSSESSSYEDEESSSESDLKAPLQRKSAKSPGSVMKMLVHHCQEALDQSSAVAVEEKSAVTSGVKLVTYFNLLVRPHFPSTSRDMKEMYMLAVALDLLRCGKLQEVGDALASRFLAVHCAASEGNWSAAKFLEMYPLEVMQSAPTELLLKARKHHRLIQKSQGVEQNSWAPRLQSRGKLERRRKRRGERKRKRKEGKRQRPTAVLAERQLESMAEPRGSVVEEAEGAERSQGESGKGKGKGRQVRTDEIFIYDRGEEAPDLGIHYELFGRLLEAGSSLRSVGCLLAWSIIHATCMSVSEGRVTALRSILAGKYGSDLAMRRLRNKEAFPLRLGGLAGVIRALRRASLEEVSLTSFVREWSDDCWLFCCIEYNNYLRGCRSSPVGCWRKSDLAAVGCLRRAVERTLAQDVHLPRSVKEVEKELSHRFVSYSGGEVPTMEILTFDQVVPALPPKGHGGCIPVTSLVKGRTRSFLLHPEDCIVEDCGQPLPKLQAKCHILEEDRLRLALSLVERGVCFWCEESAVFTYRQQKVLNGLIWRREKFPSN